MTPDQLKASILQLAIQGKLVPQRPEEGTAEDFYQQIQQEKKKLVAAGKLKKEKPLPPVTEEEIPFDIPESWKWVRLGELSKIVTGKRDANFGSIDGEYLFFTCAKDPIRCATYSFDCNAILMAGNGDLSNISRYCGKFEAYQRTYVVEGIGSVNLDYLYYHLLSNWVAYNKEKIYGSVIQYVRLGNLLEYAVALPPLAEQQRIVEKIEQMLPLVEQYGEAYTALESLDARFPDDMRKSILQYAIQGKLVPQRPEDGTAEELYQQIQKEKKKLIAADKLKKKKPLPPISEDEIPFDIPDSWKWVRLGELCFLDKGAETESGKLPYLEARAIRGKKAFEIRESGCYVKEKTLVILVDGENSGEIFRTPSAGYMGSTFNLLVVINEQLEEYIILFMRLQQEKLKNNKRGAAIPHLDKKLFRELLVPLPPSKEQMRITEAVWKPIFN